VSRYSDEELHAMEHDPDYWDWESAEVQRGASQVGLRVVIDLDATEAELVAGAAAVAGVTLIDFMRAAALERARADRVVEAATAP
jgi:uncharacterized protein (DUF1778 family)